MDRLSLHDPVVLVQGFHRPNIRLEVTRELEDHAKRKAVLDSVTGLTPPGLLYVATRKDTSRYAEQLAGRGLRAEPYHGGMKADERRRVHEQFTAGDADVVVATSAFGMGIDKPDVHFVVHASAPASLDSYYEEIGRSGRDGDPSLARLFYRPEDLSLQRFLTAHHADEEALRATFEHVQAVDSPVRITKLRKEVDASARKVTAAVNLLEEVGTLRPTKKGYTATERPAAERVGADTPFPVDSRVVHREWGAGTVMSVESDRLTVLFDDEGYRTLALEMAEDTDLLWPEQR